MEENMSDVSVNFVSVHDDVMPWERFMVLMDRCAWNPPAPVTGGFSP